MSSQVRVRLAPSPTGYFHVGGARTALFNWLFARANEGCFILRIEDTDRNRYQEGAVEELFESLRWLGLDWDEGPEAAGEHGPYYQSQRTELYTDHAEKLIENGDAYRCFCTPERLQKVREERQKMKDADGTGYDRHCRKLTQEEIEKHLSENRPSVVRLKVPLGQKVVFHDLIRGEIDYQSDVLDDLVLLKSDGFPTYHLANVIDDHFMGISHVLRGDEWISSTHRHILLYNAFGWNPPTFAHMPVILSPDGGKLSKRKGAASVMDYKNAGYLPEALFNFLALLGWSPGDDREKMSRDEIIGAFTLDRISPKSAVFDEKKLEWMNGLYLRERTVEDILEEVLPQWHERGWIEADLSAEDPYLLAVVGLLRERAKTTNDLADMAGYFFQDPESYEEKAVKKQFKGEARNLLGLLTDMFTETDAFDHGSLETLFRIHAEKMDLSVGKLIHPTRLAVTGVSFGPGLFELLETLGREAVLRRMKRAIEWLEKQGM